MARPLKPYTTSWGETVVGLIPIEGNNRWRLSATGERFTADEYTAVARLKQSQQRKSVFIPIAKGEPYENAAVTDAIDPKINGLHYVDSPSLSEGDEVGQLVDETATWEWLRKQIIERPEYVAQMTRIPQLATLASLALPSADISLKQLLGVYKKDNPSSDHTKNQVISIWRRMEDFTGADTLRELTQPKLSEWREHIEKTVEGSQTRVGYYGKIKTVIAFGLKMGMEQTQIRSALDRCKVLWTAEPLPQVAPNPISRADYHRLLETAGNGKWRVWLLLALNLCISIDECCALKWESFDLGNAVYSTIRNKTKLKSVPRAATLWDETMVELNKLDRRGPYVLKSQMGTRYSRNSRVNDFAEFRDKAKITTVDSKRNPLTFGWIRDGAYTAACHAHTVDNRYARLLAGHKADGLQDNYVLRNPSMVRPACEAVYKHYFS